MVVLYAAGLCIAFWSDPARASYHPSINHITVPCSGSLAPLAADLKSSALLEQHVTNFAAGRMTEGRGLPGSDAFQPGHVDRCTSKPK
jgi:hypothetical protein